MAAAALRIKLQTLMVHAPIFGRLHIAYDAIDNGIRYDTYISGDSPMIIWNLTVFLMISGSFDGDYLLRGCNAAPPIVLTYLPNHVIMLGGEFPVRQGLSGGPKV